MPSILPPSTDRQAEDALSVLRGLAPPCEYYAHDQLNSQGAAEWVVVIDRRRVCPCPLPEVRLFCDPCWRARNQLGTTRCLTCGRVYGCMETILRVERL